MSGSDWKESLSPLCLYVYGIDLQILRAEDLPGYGVVDVIAVPDPAHERGGIRFLVLFHNEAEVQRRIQTQGITYKGTTLQVENANNTCDIPPQWEQYVIKPLQYPSNELRVGENEGTTYANVPRFQEQGDVYSSPLPPMQGQQMQAPPGQPMVYPPQFFMPGFPPNMYPPQGATGQDVPAEAGNFPDPKQIWIQQMQLFQQMQMLQQYGGMQAMAGATAAPPPYSASEEETCSKQNTEESTSNQPKLNKEGKRKKNKEHVTPSAPNLENRELVNSLSAPDLEFNEPVDPSANQGDTEAKQTENPEKTMIKVTNIPPDTSKDALEFFFENRRRSGGGPIEELEYDPDTKSASEDLKILTLNCQGLRDKNKCRDVFKNLKLKKL